MKIKEIISRMDEVVIRGFFPDTTIQVLDLLDNSMSRIANLQRVLAATHSEHYLLSNKKTIYKIISLLREEEILALAGKLGIDISQCDPWERLRQENLKTKKAQAVLKDFFELQPESSALDDPSAPSYEAITTISPDYKLFSHQITAILKIKDILKNSGKVLLHMPTGSGKTRTTMNLIGEHLRDHHSLVIWFAHTEELCSQAAEEFCQAWRFLGNRDLNLHRLWGNHKVDVETVESGFMIASFQKINSMVTKSIGKVSRLAAKASLVIMDEAHMAIAPTFRQALDIFTSFDAPLVGLSATPGRTWNDIYEDSKLSAYFLKQKVSLTIPGYDNPVDYLTHEGYLSSVIHAPLMYQSGVRLSQADINYLRTNLQLPAKILNELSEDVQRNTLIVHKVKELLKEHTVQDVTFNHKRILLFAINVNQSNLLAAVLQASGIQSYSLTSETPATDRRKIIETYKSDASQPIVLCNYGILTTGFDAPQTSCAVITRPTDSLVLYSQMVGRAIRGRKAGGNKYAEIITVVDSSLPGFESIESAFFNWEDVW